MTNTQIQKALVTHGFNVSVDGKLGPQTVAAIRQFQRKHNLVIDGIAGPRTLSALQGEKQSWALTQLDILHAAKALNCTAAAVHAVAEIESRGVGFIAPKLPSLLFERHIFFRRLKAHGYDPMLISRQQPDIASSIPGGYHGGTIEHDRLARAMSIHHVAAIESASWGRFQIMGFHWQRLGYPSADAFKEAMCTNEGHHLEAFVAFVKTDTQLHRALRSHDWQKFARLYNGQEYAKNRYDQKLASAFQRFSGAIYEQA